jgi:hypothetical protein
VNPDLHDYEHTLRILGTFGGFKRDCGRGLWVWYFDVMHDCAGVFAFGPSDCFEQALFNALEGEGWHGGAPR